MKDMDMDMEMEMVTHKLNVHRLDVVAAHIEAMGVNSNYATWLAGAFIATPTGSANYPRLRKCFWKILNRIDNEAILTMANDIAWDLDFPAGYLKSLVEYLEEHSPDHYALYIHNGGV